jgi:hypothetical protein
VTQTKEKHKRGVEGFVCHPSSMISQQSNKMVNGRLEQDFLEVFNSLSILVIFTPSAWSLL